MCHLHLLPKVMGQPSRDTDGETSQREMPPVICTTPGSGPAGPQHRAGAAPQQPQGPGSGRVGGRVRNMRVWAPEPCSLAEMLSLETGDRRPPVSVFLSSGDCGKEGVRSPLLRTFSPRPAPAQLLPLALSPASLQICVREEQLPQQSRTDGD